MEPLNDNNAVEITYNDHVDLTFTADQLQPHNNSTLSNELPFHWSLQTQYYLAEYEVNVVDRRFHHVKELWVRIAFVGGPSMKL